MPPSVDPIGKNSIPFKRQCAYCLALFFVHGESVSHTGLAYGLAFFLPYSHERTPMSRQMPCPTVVGVRLSEQDGQKLQHLCATTQRPPRDVLRLLVRLAQPPDLPAVQCATSSDHQACHA